MCTSVCVNVHASCFPGTNAIDFSPLQMLNIT